MINGLVDLDIKLQRINDVFSIIERRATDKTVLNIGAAGGVRGYLPRKKDVWLHERIRKVAKDLIGTDIDADAIAYAAQHGYDIKNENAETMTLSEKFELIVMSDVIEHVNAPVTAIENLLSHLSDNGRLIITTPNATSGNIFLRGLVNKKINVLGDHVATYYPEHFKVICERIGCQLENIYMFDFVDRRSTLLRFKSAIFKAMTFMSPRLASSMMVVIKK